MTGLPEGMSFFPVRAALRALLACFFDSFPSFSSNSPTSFFFRSFFVFFGEMVRRWGWETLELLSYFGPGSKM